MAKFTKRSDGRYATSVRIGYKDNGKPKIKTIYGKTIRELEAKVADFKSLMNKGIIVNDNQITVSVWAKQWLNTYKSSKAYNTTNMYEYTIEKYINPLIGNVKLSVLKKNMLQNVINEAYAGEHRRTADIVRMTLKQLIDTAIDEQYLYIDIAKGLTLPSPGKKEKRPLSDDELRQIREAELTSRERTFIDILIYAGLRRGEILALKSDDIDFKNNVIHINKAVIFKGNSPELKPCPKSDSGIRDIPIPKQLRASLLSYMSENIGSEYLFPMTSDVYSLMTLAVLRKFWQNIKTKIGLPKDVTLHTCRHTYATKLFYGGVDMKAAQKLLGHSNIRMTLDIYTHLQENDKELQTKLDSVFNL